MTRRLFRIVLSLAIAFGAFAGITATAAAPAGALCVANPVGGDWRNIDTGTRSMTRVVVETCAPVTTCSGGICTTTFDAGTFVSAWGKCSPTDCAWGRRQAQPMSDGWYRATYDFGFKTSSVWVKTYVYWGRTYLRVWVHNDFTPADGRTDYTTDDWFLPA